MSGKLQTFWDWQTLPIGFTSIPEWYDDGSEEEARAEHKRAAQKRAEVAQQREADSVLARESEKLHELKADAAELMYEALMAAEQIVCRAPRFSTNDGGKFRNISTESVLKEIRVALAKANPPKLQRRKP